MRDEPLFSRVHWHRQVHAQLEGAKEKIQNLTASELSAKSDEQLKQRIIDECKLDVPVINDAEISVGSSEVTIEGRPGQRITVHIPFIGDRDLFFVQPPTYSGHLPRGDVAGEFIQYSISGTNFHEQSPKKRIDDNIANIKQYLDWQRSALDAFSQELEATVASAIVARRKQISTNASVVDGLGFKKR